MFCISDFVWQSPWPDVRSAAPSTSGGADASRSSWFYASSQPRSGEHTQAWRKTQAAWGSCLFLELDYTPVCCSSGRHFKVLCQNIVADLTICFLSKGRIYQLFDFLLSLFRKLGSSQMRWRLRLDFQQPFLVGFSQPLLAFGHKCEQDSWSATLSTLFLPIYPSDDSRSVDYLRHSSLTETWLEPAARSQRASEVYLGSWMTHYFLVNPFLKPHLTLASCKNCCLEANPNLFGCGQSFSSNLLACPIGGIHLHALLLSWLCSYWIPTSQARLVLPWFDSQRTLRTTCRAWLTSTLQLTCHLHDDLESAVLTAGCLCLGFSTSMPEHLQQHDWCAHGFSILVLAGLALILRHDEATLTVTSCPWSLYASWTARASLVTATSGYELTGGFCSCCRSRRSDCFLDLCWQVLQLPILPRPWFASCFAYSPS